jgi:hypothetical protein
MVFKKLPQWMCGARFRRLPPPKTLQKLDESAQILLQKSGMNCTTNLDTKCCLVFTALLSIKPSQFPVYIKASLGL